MANRAAKEKFFAQLDSLDESTETETESETNRTIFGRDGTQRQRLNPVADSENGAREVNTSLKIISSSCLTNVTGSRHPHSAPLTPKCEQTGHSEHPARKQQTKLSHNTAKSTRPKQKSSTRISKAGNGLFENFTFYFIPNDDVAKPRRLRIQSAISQGAVWERTLGPDVTHVIVDPDIPATAVAKYVKENTITSSAAFVKMNWLIESLSHRSVRNPSDSRFQLKGANLVSTISTRPAVPPTISKEMPLIGQLFSTSRKDADTSTATPQDELDQIVQNLKTAPDLPFDEEMDLDQLLLFSSGDEQAEQSSNKHKTMLPAGQNAPTDELDGGDKNSIVNPQNAGFSCMQSNPSKQAPTPNDRTLAILQQMATYYDRTGDNWRTLAYRRAITALRKQDTHVKTAKQARTIHGIGIRLADKIEEIVTTDRLKRLEAVLSDPNDVVLQLFMSIYGVGLRQARAWIEQGYRTLEDLVQNANPTPNQKIGIAHHADFSQRIPRSEVKQHGDIVAQALKMADRNLQSIIGGSYRRGNTDSGDIDVIITHPTATPAQLQTWIFDTIVPHLFKIGFMKCSLATSRPTASTPQRPTPSHLTSPSGPGPTTSSGSKFHGASQLPPSPTDPSPPWRRIDLLLVPPTSIGAALIYFTGNDIFNRSLRLLASKKGMRLNQHGLYKDVMRGKGRVKITEGELVEGRSEKRIFEVLGVPWRPATERNC